MKPALDFYFDFSSPYGYLAAQKIEPLAARYGRGVTWRPMLLGAAFKTTGAAPLPQVPLKGEYSIRDFARSARFHGIAFKLPQPFPVSTLAACRTFYSLTDRAVPFAKACLKSYFVEGINIGEAENVVKVAASVGCSPDAVRNSLGEQAVKDKTKGEVDAAVARGVFGSPYIVVDGEPFWGLDRFDQLERWLAAPF